MPGSRQKIIYIIYKANFKETATHKVTQFPRNGHSQTIMEKAGQIASENVIGLNIGGQVYLTTRSTLNRCDQHSRLRESVFGTPSSRLFAPPRAATDAQGNFFFDRDGIVFRHILNYLRNEELLLPENFEEFDLLIKEAEFYGLEELKQRLKIALMKQLVGSDG